MCQFEANQILNQNHILRLVEFKSRLKIWQIERYQLYEKIIAKHDNVMRIPRIWGQIEANQILNQITLCPSIHWIWFPAQNLSQNGISIHNRTEQIYCKRIKITWRRCCRRKRTKSDLNVATSLIGVASLNFFLRSVTRLPLRSIFLRRVPLRKHAIEPLDGYLQISSE